MPFLDLPALQPDQINNKEGHALTNALEHTAGLFCKAQAPNKTFFQ